MTIGDEPISVAVDGDYAIVTVGEPGIEIVDVSDPTNAEIISSFDTDGFAYDVVIQDSYAYVADQEGGMAIVDIQNPSAPTGAGVFPGDWYADAISVQGGTAYVSFGHHAIRIVDVSDPYDPVQRGWYDTGHYAFDLTSTDNLFIVADGRDGIYVIRNDLVAAVRPTVEFPQSLRLAACYPNPVRDNVTVRYSLPRDCRAIVSIHNLAGHAVTMFGERPLSAGWHELTWHASSHPPGVYVCRVSDGLETSTRHVVVVR